VSENAEIVRRWLDAPKATQDDVRAATLELWAEDGQYYPVAKFPEAPPSHGREEILEWFGQFVEVWSDYAQQVRRIIEVEDDRVLACTTMRAAGRVSGVELQGDLYLCFWLRKGLLIRREDHLTLAGALRALGLQGNTLTAAGLEE
jgi:ketosteroid isomerase-like protein